MAETAPIIAPPAPLREAEYKPLSLMAVASVAMAGLFAIALIALVVFGIIRKRPIDDKWHLVLALIGFILAIVARLQIRRSDGTRGGLMLTNVAWWICVLGGGGYFAYLFANETTIKIRSQAFVESYFDKLRQQKVNSAFLQTLEPERRADPALVNADEAGLQERLEGEFAHLYPGYKASQLIQMFLRQGDSVQATPQGLKGWEYKGNTTVVDWSYRITSAEGVYLCTIRAVGVRPKGEKGLVWKIDASADPNIIVESRTAYARVTSEEIFVESSKLVTKWYTETRFGSKFFAYLETLPMEKREAVESQWLKAVSLCPIRDGLFIPPSLPELFSFGAGFFTTGNGEPPSAEDLAKFRAVWRISEFRPPIQTRNAGPAATTLRISADSTKLIFPVEFFLPNPGDFGRGNLILTLTDPTLQKDLWQLRQQSLASPQTRDDRRTSFLNRFSESSWQITGIESSLVPVPVPETPKQ